MHTTPHPARAGGTAQRRRSSWTAGCAALLVIAALLTSCTSSPNDNDTLSFGTLFEDEGVTEETTWRAIDQLWNLPTFEEKMTENRTMVEQMKTQIDTVVPGVGWEEVSEDRGNGACSGDYRFANGTGKTIRWVGKPPLDEKGFSEVSDTVLSIAANYGFTERSDLGKDTPELRTRQVLGPQGSYFVLNSINDQTAQGFTLIVGSGCYLDEEARENLRTVGIPYGADYNPWPWAIPDEPRYQ